MRSDSPAEENCNAGVEAAAAAKEAKREAAAVRH